ncbi:unnamed protein product, partial [Meganyctiphanes norvegica]
AFFLLSANVAIFTLLWYPVYSQASKFIIASALLLPNLGFLTSYIVAKIFGQSHQRALTIGVETGCQNIPCVLSIILFSFTDKQVIADLIVFPALFGLISIALMLLGMVSYKLWKRCCSRQEKYSEDNIENGALLLKQKNIPVVKSKTKPSGDD